MKYICVIIFLFIISGCNGPAGMSLWMNKKTTFYAPNGNVERVEEITPDVKSQKVAAGFGTTVITGSGIYGAIVAGSTEIGEGIAKAMDKGGDVVTQNFGGPRPVTTTYSQETSTPLIIYQNNTRR